MGIAAGTGTIKPNLSVWRYNLMAGLFDFPDYFFFLCSQS